MNKTPFLTDIAKVSTSRRSLLRGGAAGLVLSFCVPSGLRVTDVRAAASDTSHFTGFLQIDPQGHVAIYSGGAELGQGIFTNLPKIVADELEVDFDTVECRLPYGDAEALGVSGVQIIGGSMSTFRYYPVMRKVGAAAREMLIAAAANSWEVRRDECRAVKGRIVHQATQRSFTYGQLAEAASKLPIPENPTLKPDTDFDLIGKTVPRKDTPAKVDGSAQFGADIKLPDLISAALAMPPRIGAYVSRYKEEPAGEMPGVVKVVPLQDGEGNVTTLGVLAKTYWQARQAADALDIEWEGGDATLSSAVITEKMTALLEDDENALVLENGGRHGNVAEALGSEGVETLDVVYQAPYVAHACMEPLAITAHLLDDACTVWAPTQSPDWLRTLAASLTGLPRDKITVQTTFLGGGFGRKWEMDYPRQVIQLAMAADGRPVRLQWSREQDMRHDFYRPAAVARFRGGVDHDGRVTAVQGRTVTQSILNDKGMMPKSGFDVAAVEGLIGHAYSIPNTLIEWVDAGTYLPVGFWRSVGLSQNLFMSESFLDELAFHAGRDPYDVRRELLADNPKALRVVNEVAQMSGWGRELPENRGLGMAFGEGFRSSFAQVAEVSVDDGDLLVHKIWCALDCGLAIDPGAVTAQVEGSVMWGLSQALLNDITVEKGGVVQSNFTDFPVITLRNAPDVEVKIIESDTDPTGVGEAGVPPTAPAVANAVFAACGVRIRKMPLQLERGEVASRSAQRI